MGFLTEPIRIDFNILRKELQLPPGKYGFRFKGNMRNPELIEVFKKGKKIKEKKRKKRNG